MKVTPVLKKGVNITHPYFTSKIFRMKKKWHINKHFITNNLNETASVFLRAGRIIYRQDVENVSISDDLDNFVHFSVGLEKKSQIVKNAKGVIIVCENYKDQKEIA